MHNAAFVLGLRSELDAMAGSDSEQWTWAQCEYCEKWRRLEANTHIDDTQEFGCPMIGVACEDAEASRRMV